MRITLLFSSLLWLATTSVVDGRLHGKRQVLEEQLTPKDEKPIGTIKGPPGRNLEGLDQIAIKPDENDNEGLFFHNGRKLWEKEADVVIIVDGSQNVAPQQFENQKEGIVAAISNSNVVPVDGSVGIAVIQLGGSNPVVQVDYTMVERATDITSMSASILAMPQRQGNNNAGDAIQLAAARVQPRGKARQVFVLITDEPNDNGSIISLQAALKDAKRSGWKLDVFSVIAFGGRFTDDAFRAFYNDLLIDGQLVFGDNLFGSPNLIATVAFGYDGFPALPALPTPFTNAQPNVNLISPVTGTIYYVDELIVLQATATDAEDTALGLPVAIQWFYSTPLVTDQMITYGSAFEIPASSFPIGFVTIQVQAFDSENLGSVPKSATIEIRPPPVNQRPTVTILNPTQGQNFQTTDIVPLQATASDPEDGPINKVRWTVNGVEQSNFSALSGQIHAHDLAVGINTIRAVVTDRQGLVSPPSVVTFNVVRPVNLPPTVEILQPVDYQLFTTLDTIYLQARANDPETGLLPGNYIFWTLNGVPQTQSGDFLQISASDLGTGTHEIGAFARDPSGDPLLNSFTDIVYIVVQEVFIDEPPFVEILFPLDNQVFAADEAIPLSVYAFDNEDGLIYSVSWVINDVEQDFTATNTSIPASDLYNSYGPGIHTIAVFAKDSLGQLSNTDVAQIQITPVTPVFDPVVSIISPVNNDQYLSTESIPLRAQVFDITVNALVPDANVLWEIDGVLQQAEGQQVLIPPNALATGQHRITAIGVARGIATLPISVFISIIPVVSNTKPLVEINEPKPGEIFLNSDNPSFVAAATDLEDRDAALNVVWESDWDGVLGRGARIEVDLATLTIGPHLITVTVTDSGGLFDTETLPIQITEGPFVKIVSPSENQAFAGEIIDLEVSTSNPDKSPIQLPDITWYTTDSVQGQIVFDRIGTGAKTTVSSTVLPVGNQEIFVEVIDLAGRMGRDSVIIDVIPVQGQTGPAVDRNPRLPGQQRGDLFGGGV